MVVAARPDIVGAVIARLRASSDITALTSTRISASLQDSWDPMPRHAVLIRSAGGPPGRRSLNLMVTRLDVSCYGANPFEAMRLWRQLDAVFCPGQESVVSFIQGTVLVYSVDPDNMPIADVEPDTGWPRAIASYLVRWSGVAT